MSEHYLWWLAILAIGFLLLNSLVFVLATLHQKRKTNLLLKESLRGLRDRIRSLEEEMSALRSEQSDRWSEVRKTVARLEFRGGAGTERIQRPSMVGLDKKHQVCSLARQGFATEEISKKLNLYPGETELVLGLTKLTESRNARTSLQ
jgi:hypothetical protein